MQYREELGTLKEHSTSLDTIEKNEKEQENAFQAVDKAMRARTVSTGLNSSDVLSRYGKPNAIDKTPDGDRWLYRSPKGKRFEQPWYFFYFDLDGRLSHWECGHTSCD